MRRTRLDYGSTNATTMQAHGELFGGMSNTPMQNDMIGKGRDNAGFTRGKVRVQIDVPGRDPIVYWKTVSTKRGSKFNGGMR